jgi:hypothetical protein
MQYEVFRDTCFSSLLKDKSQSLCYDSLVRDEETRKKGEILSTCTAHINTHKHQSKKIPGNNIQAYTKTVCVCVCVCVCMCVFVCAGVRAECARLYQVLSLSLSLSLLFPAYLSPFLALPLLQVSLWLSVSVLQLHLSLIL